MLGFRAAGSAPISGTAARSSAIMDNLSVFMLIYLLVHNFKRINASLSAFAEWFPLRSNEPYLT
jgi:hypothetical protein